MRVSIAGSALCLLLAAAPAPAYIDGGGWQVTLPEIVSEFRTITLVEVEKVNLSRGAFRFKAGKPLKNKPDFKNLNLQMTWGEGGAPFKDVEAGRVAVHFTQSCDKAFNTGALSPGFENLIAQRACLTYMDGSWFFTTPGADGWQAGAVRRDFELVYVGSTADLADAVTQLLRGNEVAVRCRRRQHTDEIQWARYSLKSPHNKTLVRDPSAPAASTRPAAAWAAELQDRPYGVRQQAALALAELGTGAREAEAALVLAARDPDPEVRYAGVVALGALSSENKPVLDALARALSDDDWFVRLAATQSLKSLGERARPVLPSIVSTLGPKDMIKDFRPVRCGEAMIALARIDPKAKELEGAYRVVIGRLLEDERQGSFGARATGARMLGDCGPAASPALPALTKLLKDADGDVRVASAEAILKIAPETAAALPVLIDALQHPDLLVRRRAAEALGGRGAQAALRAAAQDPEPEVRQAVQEALKK